MTLRTAVVSISIFLAAISAQAAGWRFISPERVHNLVKEGSGLWIIDVRQQGAFNERHIEGAVNVPAELLAVKRFPKQKILVVADDSLGQKRAREGADLLVKNGHEQVHVLEGGIPAWEAARLPTAGSAVPSFRSVLPDELLWAQKAGVTLKILDLRAKEEREKAPISDAEVVDGNGIDEKMEKVRKLLDKQGKRGLLGKLEKPVTTILVFPVGADPRPAMERSLFAIQGDIRYLEGGYAAWAANPEKSTINLGGCPTCPGSSGGIQ